jgi:hypothetical protein
MRRMRSIMGGLTANTAGYAAAQTTVAGVAMTLAGSPVLPNPTAGQLHNSAAPVTITGVATTIASNYTVTGLTRYGNVITEVIVGPVGATTTSGHLLFTQVTSIVPSVTNNPGTASAGWAGVNFGPWLITAYHSSSAVVTAPSGGTTLYGLMVTDMHLLDPTFFHATVSGGGTPSGDMNFQGSRNAPFMGGPYIDIPTTPYPLVPAALQAACPQLLATNQTLPENDGTWDNSVGAPPTFTAPAVGATPGTLTASQARFDPTNPFAWRLRIEATDTNLIELDVMVQRRAF